MKDFKFVLILLLLTTVAYVATNIYLPSLPAMSVYFNTSNTLVQLSLPVFMVTFALTPILLGPFLDRTGRRKVILIGLAATLIGNLIILLSPNIGCLIFGRLVQGAALGAVTIAARAMIPDRFKGIALVRYQSLTQTLVPLIQTMCPVVGGFLQSWFNWQFVFGFLFLYTLTILIFSYYKLPETNTVKARSKQNVSYRTYIDLLKNKKFVCLALMPCFMMIGLSAFTTASPYLFQNTLKLSPSEFGVYTMPINLIIMISGIINIRLIRRVNPVKIILFGSFLMILSGLMLGAFHWFALVNVWTLVIPCMIYFFCNILVATNGYSLACQHVKGQYGSGVALMAAMKLLFGIIASLVVCILPENVLSLTLMFSLAGTLTIVAMVALRASKVSFELEMAAQPG